MRNCGKYESDLWRPFTASHAHTSDFGLSHACSRIFAALLAQHIFSFSFIHHQQHSRISAALISLAPRMGHITLYGPYLSISRYSFASIALWIMIISIRIRHARTSFLKPRGLKMHEAQPFVLAHTHPTHIDCVGLSVWCAMNTTPFSAHAIRNNHKSHTHTSTRTPERGRQLAWMR